MPVRATKRGSARSVLGGEWDVLVCGASFAGLAVARELCGSGARVLLVDRYEIGERSTSACTAPTAWLSSLGLDAAVRQTFSELVVHTPRRTFRWRLPWTFSTFDYRVLCSLLFEQAGRNVTFETATVRGRVRDTVHTDRGDVCAPLIVDALGWRRVLGLGANVQPIEAPLSRALEVHPDGAGSDLELWVDPRYVAAGYAWSFPAGDELRVGVGSFAPADHVKGSTLRLASDLAVDAVRFQGNWIPHEIRPGIEDGVFFAGDSAGHCLPTTAEGIRTALYFGLACGRELRDVIEGRQAREHALARYGAFTGAHALKFGCLLHLQRVVGRVTRHAPWLLSVLLAPLSRQRVTDWAFGQYLDIAPPAFARLSPSR